MRRDFVETLWSDARTEAEWSWKSSARQRLNEFEGQVLEAVDAGVKSYSGQTTWTLTNSFIYSISLISTIGILFDLRCKCEIVIFLVFSCVSVSAVFQWLFGQLIV